jgi:hypothetical protein
MNEVNIDVVLDPPRTNDGDASVQRGQRAAGASHDEHLPTTRLPPISPPPMRPPSIPPTGVVASGSGPRNSPTIPPQAVAPTLDAAPRYYQEPNVQAKPSWFRALLTSTSPPPAMGGDLDIRRVRRVTAVVCACASVVFGAIALVFAFRAPPSLGTMPPLVAAAVVVEHALLALGSGALAYGLLRTAERLSNPADAA